MKKVKISSINLAQQTWFKNGFNDMWIPNAVQSLENICDPRLWIGGVIINMNGVFEVVDTFASTKQNVKIPVLQGTLTYTSNLPVNNTRIVVCEYSSSNVLLNRKYDFLKTESILLNINTSYIRVSIGGSLSVSPGSVNLASIYGLRFNISN